MHWGGERHEAAFAAPPARKLAELQHLPCRKAWGIVEKVAPLNKSELRADASTRGEGRFPRKADDHPLQFQPL